MSLYEVVYIARQDITATQVEALTEQFQNVITEGGGTVVRTESWGLRTIAYKIKKNRKGHYVMLHLDAPAAAIHEMERQMRINEDLLRYLTLRVDAHDPEPSMVLQNKDTGDRPRRPQRSGGERGGYGDGDRGGAFGGAPRAPRDDAPAAPAPAAAVEGDVA